MLSGRFIIGFLAPILQPLKDRADRILKDLENRNTTGMAAMDMLAALAVEKEVAAKAAKDSGLTPKAFAVFWGLRDEPSLKAAGLVPMELARETETLLARFPNAAVNADEQRRLRAALYRPLLELPKEARTRVVDAIVAIVLG
jgi:type I restriction enzyme, R subunit